MCDEPSDDPNRTLTYASPAGSEDQIDILRSVIPADWQPLEASADREVYQCDLGVDMPRIRIEEEADGWVGMLLTVRPDDRSETDACDSLNTAALHLRELLFRYGTELIDRGESLVDISQQST